jgi:predicted DNA-binding protein (UPF0251 family)
MPEITRFKPEGAQASSEDEVVMTLDEFEAVRLAYYEGMYQEQAAAMMNVSRPTFGRIIDSAQMKIADFLVNGKGLRITGGEIFVIRSNQNPCESCKRASERCDRGKDGRRCHFCRKGSRKIEKIRHGRPYGENNS